MSVNFSVGQNLVCPDALNMVDLCSWQVVAKILSLSLFTLGILVGNSMVIIAVVLFKKLRRTVSNLFILSLAVADLLVAIVVLPFSTVNEVLGYWIFGDIVCNMWLLADIAVSTASILHLCAISVDRYIAICYPLRYHQLMTRRRSRIICLCMWLLAIIISIPALLWRESTLQPTANETDTSATNYTSYSTVSIEPNTEITADIGAELPVCLLTVFSHYYVIYSALGSFFLPAVVITSLYIRIFYVARKFVKRANVGRMSGYISSFTTSEMRIHQGSQIINPQSETSTHTNPQSEASTHTNQAFSPINDNNNISTQRDHCYSNEVYIAETQEEQSKTITSENSAHRDTVAAQKSGSQQILSSKSRVTRHNPSKKTRNSIKRENRATKTVAAIVGTFFLCWLPFFTSYVIDGTSNIVMSPVMKNVFFWIGYTNSLLNPCVYAYMAKEFCFAFQKIMQCQFWKNEVYDLSIS